MQVSVNPVVTVVCDTCGKKELTADTQDPDSALACDCCPEDHSHAGLGCRTITIIIGPAE
jgi:hypothetical protein